MHLFMRSFDLEELYIVPFFLGRILHHVLNPIQHFFFWKIELENKIDPLICGMSPSHEGFMYMWNHLVMF
jgi:hypothetical protein